jgi:hypothetical protein
MAEIYLHIGLSGMRALSLKVSTVNGVIFLSLSSSAGLFFSQKGLL